MTNRMDKKTDGLTVITTHTNADFDAMGSLLAAHKLYPGSIVVFPGFHEKGLRNFFINSMAYLFNMVNAKTIESSQVKQLVIVDTKQASRIGELASLVGKPGVQIHIYDHHPAMKNDIRPDFEVNRSTGANVTLLTELLIEKKIDITPEEATVICLGIYEDTGSFTFPSTTESDFMAAAYLLSKGANLSTISHLMSKEMEPRQISLLNDIINAAQHYTIHGVDLVIACVACDDYIHDLAFLAQKMMKIENLNAIFVIALMGNKVYVAARSRIPAVDVGAIVTELGGGGHGYAAAAVLKDKTIAQTEHELLDILQRRVGSGQVAKNIMSSPPITADAGTSCKEARELLSRYNVNALLVTEKVDEKERLRGFISRQVIEKALYHSLDDIRIGEYMTTEFATVGPDSELNEIQSKIIENKQRVLPVMQDDRILGVITRTDLLSLLVQESQNKAGRFADPDLKGALPRTKNITGFMEERLSPRLLDVLRRIGEVAEETGCSAYVVGGFVRDLFLYRQNEDLDIVIEGNGIKFAKSFAKRHRTRINTYDKFGTAVIIFEDGFKIDVASARMEYYEFPAALPTVEMSSIKLDLFRRDFTINTLAISLNPNRYGTLIDFFGAQRDIKERAIRILHNLSFVEDPTRVFRAIRFEQRFGFKIGKLTAGLIENAVKMDFFRRLSGRRVFSELCQILKEDNPAPALIRLNEFNLLKVIDPSLRLDSQMITHFNSAKKVLSWFDLLFTGETYMKWTVYFLLLMRNADERKSEEVCSRFELSPKYQKIFIRERLDAEACLNRIHRTFPLKNSQLYGELKEFRIELILYMMAILSNPRIIKAVSHYITDLRHIQLSVSGRDIRALGLSPSPVYGKILRAALDARLNGEIKTREEELEFIRSHVAQL